jgi:hypothetical protein
MNWCFVQPCSYMVVAVEMIPVEVSLVSFHVKHHLQLWQVTD